MKITESSIKKIVKVLENATPVFTVTIYNVRVESESYGSGEYVIRFEDSNNYTLSIYFYGNDSANIQFGVFDEKGFYRWFAEGDITKCTIYDVVFMIAAKIKEMCEYVDNVVIPHDWAEYHAEPDSTTTEPETNMIEYIMKRIETDSNSLVWKHKHKVMYYFDATFEVLAALINCKYSNNELTDIQREFLHIYLQDKRFELESMGLV